MESGIQKIFTIGIRNPGNIFSWNPESRTHLLVESGIQDTFARGIRNPENISLWNPEFRKYLLVESGIIFFGIRKPGLGIWNPVRRNLESSTGIRSLHHGFVKEPKGLESEINTI